VSIAYGLLERRVVNDVAAGRVDDVRAGLQLAQQRSIHDRFRFRSERQVQAQDVRGFGDFLETRRRTGVGRRLTTLGEATAPDTTGMPNAIARMATSTDRP
jgi:hypothetical protein